MEHLRRRKTGILNFCALAVGSVLAAVSVPNMAAGQAASSETGTAAEPPKVRITKKDCRRLVRHTASADVAYQPGVDVRGNPVVPADAGGGFTIPLPDVYEFNITKDLSAYLDGPEEQLAADKAAAIAAEKSVAATDAAVSSAALSLAGAQTQFDSASAAATAAQAAADADPSNTTLAATAATAQTSLETATTNLATTQAAFDATQASATANDVTGALSNAQATLTAAQTMGYTQDAAATTASTNANQAATASASADAAALSASETVAKSADMSLNIGTVRFNINTGAMTFNGKPLTDASSAELAEKCRQMMSAQ